MSALNSGRRRPGILLPLSLLILVAHSSHSAPLQESDSTQVAELDGGASGCYYNFQHYTEGARILTNEPCLNCTCHNRMLMCYLRVCPFTKAIGQDCTVEKRPDQCCPVITCPEVPVQLLTSTSTTSSPSQSSSTEIGRLESSELGFPDTYGCNVDDRFYADGAQLPLDASNPCELCYCIRNKTTCLMQQCTLAVAGCKPVYQHGICCPVKYNCEYDGEYEAVAGTTPGLIMTTTLAPHMVAPKCQYDDKMYEDGELIYTIQPCQHCYCFHGEIVCAVQECGKPMEAHSRNCTALPPLDGECCPTTYQCDGALSETATTMPGSKTDQEFFPGADNVIPEQIHTTERPEIEQALGNEVPEAQPTKSSLSEIGDSDSEASTEINTVQPHTGETGSRKSEVVTSEVNEINQLPQSTEPSISTSSETHPESSQKDDLSDEQEGNLVGTEASVTGSSEIVSSSPNAIQSEATEESIDDQGTKYQEPPSLLPTAIQNQESEKSTMSPGIGENTDKSDENSLTTLEQNEELTTVKNNEKHEPSEPTLIDEVSMASTSNHEESTVDSHEGAATPISSQTSSVTNEVSASDSSTPVLTSADQENSILLSTEESGSKEHKPEEFPTTDRNESQYSYSASPETSSTSEKPSQNNEGVDGTTVTSKGPSESSSNEPSSSEDSQEQGNLEDQQLGTLDSEQEPHRDSGNSMNELMPTQIPQGTGTADQSPTDSSNHDVEGLVKEKTDDGNAIPLVTDISINDENTSKDILGEPEIPDQGPTGIPIPERLPEHKAEDNDAVEDSGMTENYIHNNSGMPHEIDSLHTDQPGYGPTTYLPPDKSEGSNEYPSTPSEEKLPKQDLETATYIPDRVIPGVTEKTLAESTDKISSIDETVMEKEKPGVGSNTLREDSESVTQLDINVGSTEKTTDDHSFNQSSSSTPDEQPPSPEETSDGTLANDSENDIHSHVSSSEYEPVTQTSSESITTSLYETSSPKEGSGSPANRITLTSEIPLMNEAVTHNDRFNSEPLTEAPTSASQAPTSERDQESNLSHEPNVGDHSLIEGVSGSPKDSQSSTEISNAIIAETLQPEITSSESSKVSEPPVLSIDHDNRDQSIESAIENKTELNEIVKDSSASPGIDENHGHPLSETSDQDPSAESGLISGEMNGSPTSRPFVENKFANDSFEQQDPGSTVSSTIASIVEPESPTSQLHGSDEEPTGIDDENLNMTESENDITPMPFESSTTSRVGSIHGIPGEGNCLVDGQSYNNNSAIPPVNACQLSCRCISSIVQCELIKCTPPPADVSNCIPVFTPEDLCCPMYTCETTPPAQLEVNNQMSGSHGESHGEITTQSVIETNNKELTSTTELSSASSVLADEKSESPFEPQSSATSASPPRSDPHEPSESSISSADEGSVSSSTSTESVAVSRETETPDEMIGATSPSAEGASSDIDRISPTSASPFEVTSSSDHREGNDGISQSSTDGTGQETTSEEIGNLPSISEVNAYSDQSVDNNSDVMKPGTPVSSTSTEGSKLDGLNSLTSDADQSKEESGDALTTLASLVPTHSSTENILGEHVEMSTETYETKLTSTVLPNLSSTAESDFDKKKSSNTADSNGSTVPFVIQNEENQFTQSSTTSDMTTEEHVTPSEKVSDDENGKTDESGSETLIHPSSNSETALISETSESNADQNTEYATTSSSTNDREINTTITPVTEEMSGEFMDNVASHGISSDAPTLNNEAEEQQAQKETEQQSETKTVRPFSGVPYDKTTVIPEQQNDETSSTSAVPSDGPGVGIPDEKPSSEEPIDFSPEHDGPGTELSPRPSTDESENNHYDQGQPQPSSDTTEKINDVDRENATQSASSGESDTAHDPESATQLDHKGQSSMEDAASPATNLEIPEDTELPLVIKDAETSDNANLSSSLVTDVPEQEYLPSDDTSSSVEKGSSEPSTAIETTSKNVAEEETIRPEPATTKSPSTESAFIAEGPSEHPHEGSIISNSDKKDPGIGSIVPEETSQETGTGIAMENEHSTTPKIYEEFISETNLMTTYSPASQALPEMSPVTKVSTSSTENSDLMSPDDEHVDLHHTDEPILPTSHEEEHRPEVYASTIHPGINKPHSRPEFPDQNVPETDDESIFPPDGADIKDPYDTSDPESEDYDDQAVYGPGTCRYGGKIYMSAQQIPRDDACDFCFCFRSDIICLQQSCPPPIPGCHEEAIGGFCCPRYECPVSMATSLNITTTTTTTTTTIPPHFLSHAYKGSASRGGCLMGNRAYKVGEEIKSKSTSCRSCVCGGDGQMNCSPLQCSASPMLKEMIAHAAARKRRRRAIHS